VEQRTHNPGPFTLLALKHSGTSASKWDYSAEYPVKSSTPVFARSLAISLKPKMDRKESK